jgi:two-component system response regulator HydG
LVEEGTFREDLYYRINVISVAVPPLCTRGTDVLLLAQHFIEQFSAQAGKRSIGLAPSAAQQLMTYDWPGNVRELQNCMERAVALCRADLIEAADLPDRVREYHPRQLFAATNQPGEWLSLEEVERRYVLEVLKAVHGNKSSAAQILGLSRKTLYRRLRAYGVGGSTPDE